MLRHTTPAWLVVAAVALTACDPLGSGGGSVSAPEGTVRIEIGEPRHLLPTNTNDPDGAQVLAALFAPLADYDAEHRPYEVAAESITSADNRTWTITLKDGYTFHNGEKVTADSYLNAWNYGAYAPNDQSNSYYFAKISGYADTQPSDPDGTGPQASVEPRSKTLSGLEKVDDRTFKVTLSAPFTEFKTMLGYAAFYPLPAAAWREPGVLNPDFEHSIIGQGPFRLKGGWRDDSPIEVERYAAYPGDKPAIGGAVFVPYASLTSAYADLLAGDLDVVRTIPADKLAAAREELGDRFGTSADSTLQFLAFPTFQPEYAKPEVRRAISMAIDRDSLVESLFKGSQRPARSFVSPVVAGYRENGCGAGCEFDAAEARRLYAEAGGPAELRITYNADGGHRTWVDATCAQLRTNLGVACAGAAEPRFGDLLDKVERRQPVGIFRMGWPMDYPSMESYLGPLYSTTGSSNYAGYSNPSFDALVAEAMSAPNEAETIKKYQQAEDILAEDMPVIPLRFGQRAFGHSTRVHDVHLDGYGRVNLSKIATTS